MSKRIAIPVIVILAIAVAGGGYFSWFQTSNLGEAESEIDSLEDDVSALQVNVSDLEGDIDGLETQLADSEAEVATLETDLTDAESQISSLESDYSAAQSQVSSLRSQLNSAQGKYDDLEQDLDKAQCYAEILEEYYFTLDPIEISDILAITGLIDEIGDAELEEKWDAYLNNPTDETHAEFWIAVWDGLWENLYA